MATEQSNRTVLVTGATGQQGGAVARHLVGKGFKVRGMTRKPAGDAAKALPALGIEVVQGDLEDAASLERAVSGAWGVFAVQNVLEKGVKGETEQGQRLAQVARKKGVEHFVYTSVCAANRKTGIPHFESKWQIEETVRGLGFPGHTIIRPAYFMENLLSPWILMGDKLVAAIKPSTALQMIAVDDIGKFGALAFERARELNRAEIDIAGDSVTMPQAAGILSEGLGRKIFYQQARIEQVRKSSEDTAIMYEWFDRVGYSVNIAALKKTYGIAPMTLVEWARRRVRAS